MSTTSHDEPDPLRAVFRRSLRELLWATLILGVLGVGVGYLVAGEQGVVGALLGVGVGLLLCGTTVVSMLVTARRPPAVLAAVVLGAWLAKMMIIVVVLALLQGKDFYDKYSFAAVVVLVALTSVAIDVRAVLQGRIPNVEAAPGSDATGQG
jgi:dipeptide/tripeptide permease